MPHPRQSGARHCADVSGTFSGEEWAQAVPAGVAQNGRSCHFRQEQEPREGGPLIYRLDAESLASVAEVMGCTVRELIERYS